VALGTAARAFRRPGPHGFPQLLHSSRHHLRSATSCVHDPQLAPRDQDRNMGPHQRGMPGARATPSSRNGQFLVVARTRHRRTRLTRLSVVLRLDEARRRGRVPFAAPRQSPNSPPRQTPTVRYRWLPAEVHSEPPHGVSLSEGRGGWQSPRGGSKGRQWPLAGCRAERLQNRFSGIRGRTQATHKQCRNQRFGASGAPARRSGGLGISPGEGVAEDPAAPLGARRLEPGGDLPHQITPRKSLKFLAKVL